ncbi:alanine racemase [Bacillus horti]
MNKIIDKAINELPPQKDVAAWVEINTQHLSHNVQFIRAKIGPERQIMAVVKANAYGHGAVEIATYLLNSGVQHLAVATVEEGLELRKAGIKAPILLLNSILPEQISKLLDYQLTPTIYTVAFAEKVSIEAKQRGAELPIHLRLDLASNGLGMLPDQAVYQIKQISRLPHLLIEGIYTHLVSAYRQDAKQVAEDIQSFENVLSSCREELQARGVPIFRHVASSPSILNYPSAYYDLVRAGTCLYGLPSFVNQDGLLLKPVMSVKSRVCDIQYIEKGEMRGYYYSVFPESKVRVATLPIGYSHIPFLLLLKKPQVLIGGQKASAFGPANMSHLFVDVTHLPETRIGDEVVLLGAQGNEKLYAQDIIAETDLDISRCESICFISESIPRFFVK